MIEAHDHNGLNSPRINYQRILNIPDMCASVIIQDTDAATAANYDNFFISPYRFEVVRIDEVHKTAGTNAGAVTLQVERRQGTEAKGAGDSLLSTAFNLKGTVETVQNGALVNTNVKILEVGDRLGLVTSGTLTAVAHVVVTVTLKRVT